MYKTFGEWLRQRRSDLRMSPFKMAEALGYKRVSSVYNFEYNVVLPPVTKWVTLAQLLQVSLKEYLEIMAEFEASKVKEFEAILNAAKDSFTATAHGTTTAHDKTVDDRGGETDEAKGGNGTMPEDGHEVTPHSEARYRVVAGPEGLLPPAAATMGVTLPDPGQALVEGEIVPEEQAYEVAAQKLLSAKVPTIHPGPLVLFAWNEKAIKKSKGIRALYNELKAHNPNALLIPMPDYRPKYPKINPEVEINPNHPNLTIWHNKEDVCVFVGVHCHLANLSLKIIRAGTNCYTIALCAQAGHEDAMLSFRDLTPEKILTLTNTVRRLKGLDPLTAEAVYGESAVAEHAHPAGGTDGH